MVPLTPIQWYRLLRYDGTASPILSLETKLESIGVDSTVIHKKFGKGTVAKINKNEKFIHIKFTLGEKKFIFPDAFLMGFLEVE
ncbi:MAG: hypothetical protein IJB61_11300 [Bacteroides sp]|nr:hypothetical protein [Bacteroides sp.]